MTKPQTNIRSIEKRQSRFQFNAILFGPIKPSSDFDRMPPQRTLKSVRKGEEFFTDISIQNTRRPSQMGVEFSVTACSPAGAEKAGIVYIGLLCDLMSSITRQPIRFLMPNEDLRETHNRGNRFSTHVDRILTWEEWESIIGSLVYIHMQHASYLAASSWYRKGLWGNDALDVACCYFRVIERISFSYCDNDKLPINAEGKPEKTTKNCILQFVTNRRLTQASKDLLQDKEKLKQIIKLRNDVSHGNSPITPELIETASNFISPLEEAAYAFLACIRETINQSEI